MSTTRRTFLKLAGTLAATGLGTTVNAGEPQEWAKPEGVDAANQKLRILFLGGTHKANLGLPR